MNLSELTRDGNIFMPLTSMQNKPAFLQSHFNWVLNHKLFVCEKKKKDLKMKPHSRGGALQS